MPTVAFPRTAAPLLAAVLCAAPHAVAQQYAVPAGQPILFGDEPAGAAQPVYGEPVTGAPGTSGAAVGGQAGGGHAGTVMHTAYRQPAVEGEIVADSFPQVRSTQYPQTQVAQIGGPGIVGGPGGYDAGGYGGGEYVFDEPVYSGPVVDGSVCDSCDAGFAGGYGGEIYGGPAYGGEIYGGELYGGPGYGGLSDHVCGVCGTTTCTPETCDPSCEGELACGGPVVCNKFGRCGKFYNTAVARQACGFSAGYAFLFLAPRQGDATAAVVRTPAAGARTVSRREEFDYDLEHGSRIFVELIRPDAIGVRLTWSGLDADSDARTFAGTPIGVAATERPPFLVARGGTTSAALPASFGLAGNDPTGTLFADAGDTLRARGEVEFSTFDLDATRRLRAGGWLLNTGGGVRFARLEQNYSARVTGPNAGRAFSSTEFDGAGPTGYAEARRPLGNSGFALLSAARVSLLVGDNDRRATVTQNGAAFVGSSNHTDFVPVGELQVGGEWSAWVNPNTLFFTQLAYEGQLWGGVGSPGSHEGDVGFTGFNLSLGLEW